MFIITIAILAGLFVLYLFVESINLVIKSIKLQREKRLLIESVLDEVNNTND